MGICAIHSFDVYGDSKYKLTAADKVILTRSCPLVHTEWQFSQRYGSKSYSATMQGGINACRFADIGYSQPKQWATHYLGLSDESEDAAYAKALELEGKPYDLFGLLSFTTGLDLIKPDPNKYWCSEVVAELLKAALGGLPWLVPHTQTPELFYHTVRRLLLDGY